MHVDTGVCTLALFPGSPSLSLPLNLASTNVVLEKIEGEGGTGTEPHLLVAFFNINSFPTAAGKATSAMGAFPYQALTLLQFFTHTI